MLRTPFLTAQHRAVGGAQAQRSYAGATPAGLPLSNRGHEVSGRHRYCRTSLQAAIDTAIGKWESGLGVGTRNVQERPGPWLRDGPLSSPPSLQSSATQSQSCTRARPSTVAASPRPRSDICNCWPTLASSTSFQQHKHTRLTRADT